MNQETTQASFDPQRQQPSSANSVYSSTLNDLQNGLDSDMQEDSFCVGYMRKRALIGFSLSDGNTLKKDMENVNRVRLIELKEQLMFIRERKKAIPPVPDPKIIEIFSLLTLRKKNKYQRQTLTERISIKEKELDLKRSELQKYREEYNLKSQIFKEKSSLLRVFNNKIENELSRIKERYREVEFNRVISSGVKKLIFYKLAEILFNQRAKRIFYIGKEEKDNYKGDDDSIGVCIGYLGLLMEIVGKISGARMWIRFAFMGSRSTIRANDGTLITLHPRDGKFNDGLKLLNEQLYQIMHDTMGIKIQNPNNFYQLSQELTKELLGFR